MAVFIELVTDPFEETLTQQRRQARGSGQGVRDSGRVVARRPTRGLEIKEDRPASLKVIQADGSELPLVDSGSPSGQSSEYTNFLLQSITEVRIEKHQIVETFGDSYIFLFGEAPRFLDCQVVLINSFDFNWEAEWWENYENNLRGTKLAERGARLYLCYDDTVIQGYMLNCQAVKSADQPHLIQMSFRLFVTGYQNITFVGDPSYPTRASVVLPDSIDLRSPDARFQLFSNELGATRDAALADNSADANSLAESGFLDDVDPFAQRTQLSRLLRAAPRSASFPPNILQTLEQFGGSAIAASIGNYPVRGLISDNTDEYVGLPENAITNELGSGLPSAQSPTIRSVQEVEDLWIAAITALQCYGVDINNTKALQNMNLMPRFAAGVNKTATFAPSSGVGFGIGTTDPRKTNSQLLGIQLGLDVGIGSTRDPLGAVFGSNSTKRMNDRSTVQGGGDREYGYNSSYGSGPGYGKPGYGDFGGNGFGSGQGSVGDPGFKSPSAFTFSGVGDQQAAYSQFNRPTANNTVFGSTSVGVGGRIGLGASVGGLSGNAATLIAGKPSVFSITSVPGTLSTLSIGLGNSPGFGAVNPCAPSFDTELP